MTRLLRFSLVGVLGFIVDSLALVSLVVLGCGPYWGRALSWLLAATTTWICNRRFTFHNRSPEHLHQWGRFLAANCIGALVNYSIYALLVSNITIFAMYLPAAVAVGSLAGLFFNYTASKHIVFT